MKLTFYTDYSLRVLLYLAHRPQCSVTITEIAEFFDISRNHLVKVVHQLGVNGFIKTTRGRSGGIVLGMPLNGISVGQVVRTSEPDLDLLDCFNKKTDQCKISSACKLKGILRKAQNNFLSELDNCLLSDLIVPEEKFFPNYSRINFLTHT